MACRSLPNSSGGRRSLCEGLCIAFRRGSRPASVRLTPPPFVLRIAGALQIAHLFSFFRNRRQGVGFEKQLVTEASDDPIALLSSPMMAMYGV